MPTWSNSLAACVCFARWCNKHNVDPGTAADLVVLARRAFTAGERECNTGKSADRQRNRVEELAATLGLSTSWPGLSPMFKTKDRQEFHLPPV